jgi:dipeptidyl aminopeptidase/acylaminoacyl peptidase
MRTIIVAILAGLFAGSALAQEPPQEVSIPSGATAISGRLLQGVGEGVRPTIVLFNGFPAGPGIPRIATDLQNAGYTILLPQYRGVGASGGIVSLRNSREDGTAAVAWLRTVPGVDQTKVAVLGVSYGGWVALQTAASDHSIGCVLALVPADMGVIGSRWGSDSEYRSTWRTDLASIAEDPTLARFGEGGVDRFMDEATSDAMGSGLAQRAPEFADRPIFVAGGRSDPAAPFADHYAPLVDALRRAQAPFTALEFGGGHNPSEVSAAAQSFIQRRCFR